MIITVQHLRTVPAWNKRIGYCAVASRKFFKRYNLDWQDFINNGIDDSKLLATGNALAIHLVEHVKQQQLTFSEKQLIDAVKDIKDGQP